MDNEYIPASAIMDAHQVGQVRFMLVGLGLMLLHGLPAPGHLRDDKTAEVSSMPAHRPPRIDARRWRRRTARIPHRGVRRLTPATLVRASAAAERPCSGSPASPSPTRSSSPTASPAASAASPPSTSTTSRSSAASSPALIGPNGAGKTTLFNLLTGFDKPDTGTWTFDGRTLGRLAAHQVARLGMVRTFQLTKALARLTVLENMKLGATGQTGESVLRRLFRPLGGAGGGDHRAGPRSCSSGSSSTHMRDEFAGTLSGGQRKLLEMARALMTDPQLVMLDEPMAGVNPALDPDLLGHVKDLRDEGMTVIFVEHDMDVVRDISDWVVVMAEGGIIAEGTPDDVSRQPAVDRRLPGRPPRRAARPSRAGRPGPAESRRRRGRRRS